MSLFDHFLSVGDELSVVRRREYGSDRLRETAPHPLPSELYEWQGLLDAISETKRRFTMLELGAGYGRWIVRAAAALRRYRPGTKYRLIAVEAEPTHFRWLQQHTRDNHLRRWSRAGSCRLVNAAVSARSGHQDFYVGSPESWYGQALVRPENEGADAPVQSVKTVRLGQLLRRLRRVDLIDIDIQGAELEVLSEARPLLGRVRRIYVETHSNMIHEQLESVLLAAQGNWSRVVDVPLGAHRSTPLGEASFDDGGVQLWVNKQLDTGRV